ncbi:MAG: hypothetical protein KDD70_09885 [Bdellovibrionales bacterium]|nr:hypothetical protein [Bdellovibrionales bacterium]
MKKTWCTLILLFVFASISEAQQISVTQLPATYNGETLIAIDTNGTTTSATIANRTASVSVATTTARLYIRSGGQIVAAIVGPVCTKKGCKSRNVALAAKRKRIRVGKDKGDGVLVAKGTVAQLKKAFDKSVRERRSVIVSSIGSAGLASVVTTALSALDLKNLAIEELDSDNDGLVDLVDADDDGDGILDNYDPDASKPGPVTGSTQTEFPVFSNFKLGMEQTINLHATGIDDETLDTRLANTQTLAIGVAGETGETTELDCGTLSYCSSGGTGTKVDDMSDFPGTAGGANDADSDGLGEITKGMTGDFQLMTGASAGDISGGDTFIQRISNGTTERLATGMLNFVFNSTPAIKTLAVNSGTAQSIDYAATPILGSNSNCFIAPPTGDVSVTIEGWRPQRPGETDAGEAEYVDLGNSLITADIPNAPCTLSGMGGCMGMGPGNCASSSYTTSDPNLSVVTDGVQDNRGDVDADATNTYALTLNLTNCLATANSGAIAWNLGETLFVDFQFRSAFGDNAAQKFCIIRSAG